MAECYRLKGRWLWQQISVLMPAASARRRVMRQTSDWSRELLANSPALRARIDHAHQQPSVRRVDRGPRLRTSHRGLARPPHPPCPHTGDERRQPPPKTEPPQTRTQLLALRPRHPQPVSEHPSGTVFCSASWFTFTPSLAEDRFPSAFGPPP